MLNWIVLNRTDYLHKKDLALNTLQRLIFHKPNNQPTTTNYVLMLNLRKFCFFNDTSTFVGYLMS